MIYKKILEIEDKSDDEKRITFSNLDTYMNDYRTIVVKKKIEEYLLLINLCLMML